MDKHFRQELFNWTLKKIESNPSVFGGDESNRMIMNEYLKTTYGDMTVLQLNPSVFSVLSSISRAKNTLLAAYPQFDNRKRYKPKKKIA